jgi:hypothetical protein
MMGWVLAYALGLAALRNANELWAGTLALLTLGLLGVAVLGVIYERGRDRAWWLGYALFGGGYLVVTFAPWVVEGFQPKLPTSKLLGYVHSQVSPPSVQINLSNLKALQDQRMLTQAKLAKIKRLTRSSADPSVVSLQKTLKALDSKIGAIQVPTAGSVNRWQALLPGAANYDPFLRVGHCLFAILSGLAGAFVACRFHARRERGEPRRAGSCVATDDLPTS